MSEPIKPAFTQEQWADLLSQQGASAWRHYGQGDHQAAALHLHGQPFGFTWADVDRLRGGAFNVPDGYSGNPWMLELADRIAALLPPREP